MKTRLSYSLFISLLLTISSCSGDDSNTEQNQNPQPNPTFELGGTGPGGGLIFYMNSDGHGYEMGGTLGTAKWQDIESLGQATNIVGLGTSVGTGETNTALIVSTLGSGNYAAKLCADYSNGGFDDWFLPSRDEVKEMYNFFDTCGCVSMEPMNNYWSSSQGSNAGMAWNTDFMVNVHTTQLDNWTYQLQKNQAVFVKPIRKF